MRLNRARAYCYYIRLIGSGRRDRQLYRHREGRPRIFFSYNANTGNWSRAGWHATSTAQDKLIFKLISEKEANSIIEKIKAEVQEDHFYFYSDYDYSTNDE
jgi:hypothetical protein